MRKWIAEYNITPGFCDAIFKKVAEKLSKLRVNERVCALKWGEMSIKSYEKYSRSLDIIEGLIDLGPLGRTTERAKHVMVFCIDGLNAKNPWRQLIAYFFTGNSTNNEITAKLVRMCLSKLKETGALVKLLTCDQASSNQNALYKHCNVTEEKPYFEHDGCIYYASFDFPHLIKRLVIQLWTHKYLYAGTEAITAFDDFQQTWYLDKANVISNLLSHITEAHMAPNNWESMNVKRAFQMFSRRFAAAIETAGNDL